MGMVTTVGEHKIKLIIEGLALEKIDITDAPQVSYYVGDKIDITDGLYLSYAGWFTVIKGYVNSEGSSIYDKYGTDIVDDVIDMLEDKHTK